MLINPTKKYYTNQNKKISFQSQFVPNNALKNAFQEARCPSSPYVNTRAFVKAINHFFNDGKDDLIKLVNYKSGASGLFINDKRVNYYNRSDSNSINIFIDYFEKRKNAIEDIYNLSYDEFKAIKPEINKLNSDLNADDVSKNLNILHNLQNNIYYIDKALSKYTINVLENLEKAIFKK